MLEPTLWIAQTFFALFFLAAGVPKVFGRGLDRWTGFEELPRGLVVIIGVAEVAGAVALLAPAVLDRLEWTTPLAAVGLAAITLMASGFHVRAGEWLPATETGLWSVLGACIAFGRWHLVSASPPIPHEALAPVLVVLGSAIIVNLVVLFRRPVHTDA